MRNHLVFVYGSLKKGFRLNGSLEGQRYVGIACTEPKYSLFNLGQFPGLIDEQHPEFGHKAPARQIWGELYEVDEDCLIHLDKIEGVENDYYKRKVIYLDQISPVLLPTCPQAFQSLLAKTAFGYIFQLSLQEFSDCGAFWPGF